MRRQKHKLSHYKLLTGVLGKAYPVCCVEVLPGDTFQHSASVLIRLSPMVTPIMHPLTARCHHFYVPNRLTWDGWEDFITGGPENDNADTPPVVANNGNTGNLLDHLGVPPVSGLEVNALPLRAFNLIYNEYFRDQDIQTPRGLQDQGVPFVSWAKDYFTASRPFEQKGPDVTLPIGTSRINSWQFPEGTTGGNYLRISGLDQPDPGSIGALQGNPYIPATGQEQIYLTGENEPIDINTLRRAFALQRFAEARAQYGSRYVEYLRYLGVRASDGRLDRPEYLGGSKTKVAVSEVLQTSPETGSGAPSEYGVGDMYGHGISASRSNRYRRFFEEHGYVISVLSVRPHAMYMNALHRTYLRKTKEDYYQKELQFIGQQGIYNNEVYATTDASGDDIFGYADRYAEYRMQPSQVAGEFRDELKYWHLARDFNAAPALNEDFLKCEPSTRIFNVQNQDTLWMMVDHNIIARRLVAKTAIGKII